jgi:putative ABC transport system ATP-binding protein
MSQPVVEAINVVKSLGDGARKVQALKGVSLKLEAGELVLLMGPSGSGKTTLLSVLGCILSPNEGSVRVCGQSTVGLRPEALAKLRRAHIGFVFQTYHLFPTLNAVDNVRLVLEVGGERPHRAVGKAMDALAMVGLAHKVDAYPLELSSGEQQRVAIARAVVGDAAAILADEPTAALDSENGHSIMSVLAEVAKGPGRGVLVVTHDARTLPFAKRIVRIDDGRIVGEEQGVPASPTEQTRSLPTA